ncbi:MAG: DHH family phosphoesterase [Halobacteriota archaeon]
MVTRLMLGCGPIGQSIVETAAEWSGKLHVVVDDAQRVSTFREENIDAREADPSDPEAYPDAADIVFVAVEDGERTLVTARTAAERFPDALLVVCVDDGVDIDDVVRTELDELADRVLTPQELVTSAVVDVAAGPQAERMHKLIYVLRRLDGPLAVMMHDNPDPDAIASALALARIAESVGVSAEPCYFGAISHQENRALVNLLDLDLRNVLDADEIAEYDGIALVDHSRPGVNDGLPEDTTVDIVIDHHPPRAPVEARFVDLRSHVGATSTLLADYLDRFGIDPTTKVATALLYGIRIDTKDFTREVSNTDFEAVAFLLPYADVGVLDRVETPSLSAEVLDTLGRSIRNRVVRDDVVVSGVGQIRDRDALAQAADQLLDMEDIRIVLVFGFMEGTVYVSARARGTDLDLGETLREALGPIGSAGGHADMAGAQIPLGILADVDVDSRESLSDIVSDVIESRFFETLEAPPSTLPMTDDDHALAFEFLMEE